MMEKLNILQTIARSNSLIGFSPFQFHVLFFSRGKYLLELCSDTYGYSKSLLIRHNSRYSLLNEPIGESKDEFFFLGKIVDIWVFIVDFSRNNSDGDSVDLNV